MFAICLAKNGLIPHFLRFGHLSIHLVFFKFREKNISSVCVNNLLNSKIAFFNLPFNPSNQIEDTPNRLKTSASQRESLVNRMAADVSVRSCH